MVIKAGSYPNMVESKLLVATLKRQRKSNKRNYLFIIDREYRAARLLAQVFIINDDPVTKTKVHHIDFDCSNDALSNLLWVSQSEHSRIHAAAGKPLPNDELIED